MREGKSSLLSWVIIAIVLVIGLGVLLLLQPGVKAPEAIKAPTTPPPAETVKLPSLPTPAETVTEEEKAEADTEALAKALRSGSGCDEIAYDPQLKQTCLDTQTYDSALIRSDENLCKRISDAGLRQDCLDHVYLALATQSLDKTLCEKIVNAAIKTQCADRIISTMGRTAKSEDTCKTITDPKLRQDCLDNFNFGDSVQNLDSQGCASIQDAGLKDRCSKTVTKNIEAVQMAQKEAAAPPKTSEEKLADCATLQGEKAAACKDQAQFNLALEKKDLAYCQAIADAGLQKRCTDSVAASVNNYYLRLATAKKDTSLCSKILDATLRSTCLEFAK